MKNFLIVLVLVLSFGANAQSLSHYASAGVGGSLKVGGIKLAIEGIGEDVALTSTPVYVLSYHFKATEKFLVGVEATSQEMSGGYLFDTEVSGQQIKDRLDFDYSRTSLVAEGLYSFPINSEILELKSGVRVGIKREKVDVTSSQDRVDEIAKLTNLIGGININPSIVPLEISLFPIENVGLTIRTNVGPAYFAKAALTIRF